MARLFEPRLDGKACQEGAETRLRTAGIEPRLAGGSLLSAEAPADVDIELEEDTE